MSDENNENIDDIAEELAANALPSSEFVELYGFEHNCHCASDWAEGKHGLVSECYTELCDDALTRCHEYKGEVAALERTASTLRIQIAELGGEARV